MIDVQTVTASFRSAPHRMIPVGKHRLAYRRFGEGPDLVFVHGWPLHAGTFRGLVPHLAARFTCHLFDLPSAGQSESDAGARVDFASHAETTRGLADALGLQRYGLVAHDSGAFIARLVAKDDPRVAALVMGDTEIPGHHSALVAFYLAMAKLPGGLAAIRFAMGLRAVRRSSLGFGGCFARPEHLDGDFHDLFVRPMVGSPAATTRSFAPFHGFDLSVVDRLAEVHARIEAPVLMIWGTDDPIFPIAKARAMVAQFPRGATLREIKGGRAFVHDERPDVFAGHALPFLLGALGEGRGFARDAGLGVTISRVPSTLHHDAKAPPP